MEAQLGVFGGAVDGRGVDLHQRHLCLRPHGGRAFGAHQVSHLAEAVADLKAVERLAVFLDADHAGKHHVEGLIRLAFPDDGRARAIALPAAGANELPDIRIREAFEKAELLDAAEFFAQGVFAGHAVQILEYHREIGRQIEAHGVTPCGIFLQGPAHGVIKLLGQVAAKIAERRRILSKYFLTHDGQGVALEGVMPGQQLIHHRAQGKYVALAVEGMFACLLRRHVKRRPDISRELRLHDVAAIDHGDAEVSQLDVAVLGQQDVARLDVAMNDALAMGVVERLGGLVNDVDHFTQG